MSDEKLLQRLKDDLTPRADAIEKDNDTQKTATQAVIDPLSEAIRQSDQTAIRRLTKMLDGQVDEYARLVDRGDKLAAELEAIRTDDAKAQKLVDALYGKAKESAAKLGRNFVAIKKMLALAHEKEKDPRVAAMMARWAEMESWLTTQREVLKARVKQMQALVEVAEGAGAEGDQKALDQALDKAKQRATWKPTLHETGDKYMHFLADIDKVLGKELQEQLQRDLQRFKGMVSELAELNDELDRQVAKVQKVKLAPPKPLKLDTRKAADVLGVAEAELKKAWDAGAGVPEKVLDALARKLKLKTSGADMAKALRKARLIP